MLWHVPAAAQATAPVEVFERVLPLEVSVNGSPGGIWPILLRQGILHAPAEAFPGWRIEVPADIPVVEYRALRYHPLSAFRGLEAQVGKDNNTLQLTVAGALFSATKLSREANIGPKRSETVPVLFLNYDLNYSRQFGSPNTDLGLAGEAGWSSGLGVFTNTFVVRNLAFSPGRSVGRLQTTFRHDFADSGYTLSLGDSVVRTSLLGRGAYFGGLQFGTNFQLQPSVNRQPIPVLAGETSSPSVIQLYVNDVLRQTSSLPAGPFAVDNLPALMGNGNVTLRVRDILGRETVITQPFFVSADLLAVGTNDWSVEAGKLRRNLGAADSPYEDVFATGTWRRGLQTTTTGEVRLEASRTRQVAGVAAVHAQGADWLTRGGALVAWDRTHGFGTRWILGAERPGYRLNYAFTMEGNSRNFRSIGEDATTFPLRYQFAGQAGLIQPWGRVGLALAVQAPYDAPRVATVSLNYSTTIRRDWQLSAYVTHAVARSRGTTVGVALTVPLGRQTSSTTSVQMRDRQTDVYTTVQYTPPAGSGLAWRALAGYQSETPRAEAGAYYLGKHGTASADIATTGKESNVRLGATGGLVWVAGRGYAMPRFDASAALVEVAGYPGVGVGTGGQLTKTTDASGFAFIPGLAPYQANQIQLDPNALPMSAEVDSIEADAVPGWRSVARIRFPVRGGRGALIKIDFDDAEPAPAGATVHILDEAREFYVARRGEAYVTGLQASNRLQLRWRDRTCDFNVALPPANPDDIVRIGPIRCAGVAR